jgi:MFS family permease
LSSPTPHDPYYAFRFRDFRLLLIGNLIASLGGQMLALAIGWELYERTNSALVLGIVGLVEVLPVIVLSIPAGHIADHYNRKTIVILSQIVLAVASLGLTALSYYHGSLLAIYGCVLLLGIGMTFGGPASRTLSADVVPEDALENSTTWGSSTWQLAAVAGPAIGGLIIAVFGSPMLVYALNALATSIMVVLLLFIRAEMRERDPNRRKEPTTMRSLGEGIGFLRRTPIILATITLDLFAVLFGGATTLLPIFARDILQVGPSGLGWLRAAPSIGAVLMALYLAHRPPLQRAGPALLFAVAGFGVATIFFGLSQSFWISLAMLFILGALDNISVVVRSTLTMIRTPNEMRGRVAAINGLFIGASNQLGGFESGVTAQIFGPVASVVGGGIGTVVVVALIAIIWPELRGLTTLRESLVEVDSPQRHGVT